MADWHDWHCLSERIVLFHTWKPASKHDAYQMGYSRILNRGAKIMAIPPCHSGAGGAVYGQASV